MDRRSFMKTMAAVAVAGTIPEPKPAWLEEYTSADYLFFGSPLTGEIGRYENVRFFEKEPTLAAGWQKHFGAEYDPLKSDWDALHQ